MSAMCSDCGHAVCNHSGEYPGWDKRSPGYVSQKRLNCGCLIAGCCCRRWFELDERSSDA